MLKKLLVEILPSILVLSLFFVIAHKSGYRQGIRDTVSFYQDRDQARQDQLLESYDQGIQDGTWRGVCLWEDGSCGQCYEGESAL